MDVGCGGSVQLVGAVVIGCDLYVSAEGTGDIRCWL